MDIFKLYRNFWDFAFANPEKLKPNDIAIFSFAVEHCNRLGWKEKFGLPTSMVMEATGIKSYSVFKKHFDNLVENNFFDVIQYSKNQYSSNIIALKENYKALNKALDKALDKALIKHGTKQSESTSESIDSIDKQQTINNEQIKNEQDDNDNFFKNKNDPPEIPTPPAVQIFLTDEMFKTLISKRPDAFFDKKEVLSDLRQIGEKIHKWMSLQGNYTDNQNLEQINKRWGEILENINGKNYFGSMSVSQLNNNFSQITLEFNKKNNDGKTTTNNFRGATVLQEVRFGSNTDPEKYAAGF